MDGDARIEGFIKDLSVLHDEDYMYDVLHFKVSGKDDDSIVKDLPCYMISKPESTRLMEELDKSKVYIIEGAICCSDGKADLQVHTVYEQPRVVIHG